MQTGPKAEALMTPEAGAAAGTGAAYLSCPTGGWVYGMPRKVSRPETFLTPTTVMFPFKDTVGVAGVEF